MGWRRRSTGSAPTLPARGLRAFGDRRADDLRATGELRADLSDSDVADIVWSLNAAEYWVLLVNQRRWKPARFGEWLADTWTRSLLLP
jgi:hypothetical protein